MRLFCVAFVAFVLLPSLAAGQTSNPSPLASSEVEAADGQRDFASYRPRAIAVRIDAADAPKIDGDLSDPVWARANVIDEFYQVEPIDGGPPSQPTKAYILYDEKNLYIGIYAYDSEPELIRRTLMKRDLRLRDDDGVRIMIDSNGTFRDSFFFGVNPNGARVDALTENNSRFRPEWNTIWRAKARVVKDGWVVEYAIPFQSFSFDSSLEEWNLQIIRVIRRNNEEIRWSNIDRSRNRIDLTNPGVLADVKDVSSGIGLELQTFVTAASTYDWETGDTTINLNPSGNVFYKITPSLTGSLTFNTDFSDAPLDARQVNTGRFSLFFPETRNFFLQDINVFEFGSGVFRRSQNGLPLFTRRIGIVNGAPVDIVAGAKISGKQGPFNIGAIATRTAASDRAGTEGQFLSAARVSANILKESKAGVIFTTGDPDGGSNNTVGGADFQYKSSSLIGKGVVLADFVYLRSITDDESGDLFGAAFDYTGDKWGSNFLVREIGEGYDPQLGFSNRTGIRQYRSFVRRRFRPSSGPIRQYTLGSATNIVTDLDDKVEDRFANAFFQLLTNPGDEFRVQYENGFLDIRESFNIAGVVPVAVGKYRFSQYEASAVMTTARRFSVGATGRWGGIYDGDFLSLRGSVAFRPNRHFSVSGNYNFTKFSLPSGAVGIHIATISSTIAFTPDLFINTDIQYDNISENFALFSRLTWTPSPEREIFLSFGQTALIEQNAFPRSFRAQGSSIALRLGQTFRL
jgi:Carbohydrate family 9 binding domain-like/Domain of unknown function (DUF5916)